VALVKSFNHVALVKSFNHIHYVNLEIEENCEQDGYNMSNKETLRQIEHDKEWYQQ